MHAENDQTDRRFGMRSSFCKILDFWIFGFCGDIELEPIVAKAMYLETSWQSHWSDCFGCACCEVRAQVLEMACT